MTKALLFRRKVYDKKECPSCGSKFEVQPYLARTARFCSISCRYKSQETSMKGNSFRKGIPHPPEMKALFSATRKGPMNPNWRGGTTEKYQLIRKSKQYKEWRLAVFTRDKFTCVLGGETHGNDIQADHIKPFALFPELRFDVNNGRTLCRSCHKNTETYGRANPIRSKITGRFI